MSNELLRADILASWSRVSSFQEQGALLNRCYVALGEQQSTPAGYVLVPVEPTPEMRLAGKRTIKGAADCSEGEQAEYAYMQMVAAAPKDVQPPVQEPARNPDVLALNAAREIMALVYGPTPLGRSPQLLAQIQCVVSEAIVYAAQEKK